uniref:Nuclear transport factor 2 domain-containing protein n=1 Tax=Timema cristinae TaxID=61476 RepID=A0A7R9CDU4_TIMCR|nr:unnamed protein product [Timema cristinae]
MEILKKLDSGENMCKLKKEYGVGRATVDDFKKNRQKIVEHVKTMESGPVKRKILRVANLIKQLFKELNLKDVVFAHAHSWDSISPNLIQSSWKKLWPRMNTSQETEEWAAEEDLPIADWLQSFSEREHEISEADLNSWFEGNTEEGEQMMTDEKICEEGLLEMLERNGDVWGSRCCSRDSRKWACERNTDWSPMSSSRSSVGGSCRSGGFSPTRISPVKTTTRWKGWSGRRKESQWEVGIKLRGGEARADDDPPHAYSQVFVLKPLGSSFYCQHDIFRLGIHDTA